MQTLNFFFRLMRLKKLWLGIGASLVALVIIVSLIPSPPEMGKFEGSDKLGHFAAYGVMMLWFAQIYARNRVRLAIALAFVALGVALEYAQRHTGYRSFEYADMGADAAGVLCAMLLAQTPLSRGLTVFEKSLQRFIR